MDTKKIQKKFDNAFKEFGTGIFRFVYFKVSEYEVAQDITEDTFVRYWKVLGKGKIVANEKALLYFIAKGLVVDFYRKKKNIKKVSLSDVDERLLGQGDSIEDRLSQKEQLEGVLKAIKQLRKEYQEVLFLRFLEDLTIQEIAYIQKKKENAIRVLVHRALKALKEKL